MKLSRQHFRLLAVGALALMVLQVQAEGLAQADTLKVCADPNNLPFSDRDGAGFENHLAALVGQALGKPIEYIWSAQRRGFIRHGLAAGRCDIVMGVPAGMPQTLTTHPYYRSSYALIYRKDRQYRLHSLDDPALEHLKIGIHLAAESVSPPAQALAERGIVRNVVGYSLYGDYSQPSPPAKLVEAVAMDEIDVAIVWGPLGGYYSQHSNIALEVVPLKDSQNPALPFQFSIAMAVRPGQTELQEKLNAVLEKKQHEIEVLLSEYGFPVIPDNAASLAYGHVKTSAKGLP